MGRGLDFRQAVDDSDGADEDVAAIYSAFPVSHETSGVSPSGGV